MGALRFRHAHPPLLSFQLPPFLLRLFSSSSSSSSSPDPKEPHSSLPTLQPCNDADLISQLLLQHPNPFHAINNGIGSTNLTPHLAHQILLRLKNTSEIALSFFTWPHHPRDSSSYDLLIDILAKSRRFDVAWKLIVEMDHPTSTTFSVFICRLISAGLTRQAIRAFHHMDRFLHYQQHDNHDNNTNNRRLDEFRFLLDTLCKYGYPKVATDIFNQWKRWRRFQPDAEIYTVLIYGWCKINKPKMAERFFREMVDAGIEPNVVTYNVLLNGICRRSDDRLETTIRDAEKLLDEMRQRGIDPDVTSYSIVLHVYSRAHKPVLCLDKLKLMKDKGIFPTVTSYTCVVRCLCSCGLIDDAEKLLDEMVRGGVSPSAGTYNCFFMEYSGRKDGDSALKLYRRMKDDSLCLPSMHTCNILVGIFVKLNRMEIVKEVWDDMKDGGTGPDFDLYTLLIHGLCEKQMWREGCQYFEEMIEKGIQPQKVTFETLDRGLIGSDINMWRKLKRKVEEESISFGSEFRNYHFKPYKR